jgi:hypothetical protein
VLGWLLLLPTGLGILASPRLGLVPEVWLDATRQIFGGTANLIKFHYVGCCGVRALQHLHRLRKYFIICGRADA